MVQKIEDMYDDGWRFMTALDYMLDNDWYSDCTAMGVSRRCEKGKERLLKLCRQVQKFLRVHGYKKDFMKFVPDAKGQKYMKFK